MRTITLLIFTSVGEAFKSLSGAYRRQELLIALDLLTFLRALARIEVIIRRDKILLIELRDKSIVIRLER
jgi:hypothetical protein